MCWGKQWTCNRDEQATNKKPTNNGQTTNKQWTGNEQAKYQQVGCRGRRQLRRGNGRYCPRQMLWYQGVSPFPSYKHKTVCIFFYHHDHIFRQIMITSWLVWSEQSKRNQEAPSRVLSLMTSSLQYIAVCGISHDKISCNTFGQNSHALLLVRLYIPWRASHGCTYLGGASHDEIARKTFRQNTSRGGGTTCLLAWELPVASGLLFVILSCVTYLHHISMVFWLWNMCVNHSLIYTHEKIHFFDLLCCCCISCLYLFAESWRFNRVGELNLHIVNRNCV